MENNSHHNTTLYYIWENNCSFPSACFFDLQKGDICVLGRNDGYNVIYIDKAINGSSTWKDFHVIDTLTEYNLNLPKEHEILCITGSGKAVGNENVLKKLIAVCRNEWVKDFFHETMSIIAGISEFWNVNQLIRLTGDYELTYVPVTNTKINHSEVDGNTNSLYYVPEVASFGNELVSKKVNEGDFCICRKGNGLIFVEVTSTPISSNSIESFRIIEHVEAADIMFPLVFLQLCKSGLKKEKNIKFLNRFKNVFVNQEANAIIDIAIAISKGESCNLPSHTTNDNTSATNQKSLETSDSIVTKKYASEEKKESKDKGVEKSKEVNINTTFEGLSEDTKLDLEILYLLTLKEHKEERKEFRTIFNSVSDFYAYFTDCEKQTKALSSNVKKVYKCLLTKISNGTNECCFPDEILNLCRQAIEFVEKKENVTKAVASTQTIAKKLSVDDFAGSEIVKRIISDIHNLFNAKLSYTELKFYDFVKGYVAREKTPSGVTSKIYTCQIIYVLKTLLPLTFSTEDNHNTLKIYREPKHRITLGFYYGDIAFLLSNVQNSFVQKETVESKRTKEDEEIVINPKHEELWTNLSKGNDYKSLNATNDNVLPVPTTKDENVEITTTDEETSLDVQKPNYDEKPYDLIVPKGKLKYIADFIDNYEDALWILSFVDVIAKEKPKPEFSLDAIACMEIANVWALMHLDNSLQNELPELKNCIDYLIHETGLSLSTNRLDVYDSIKNLPISHIFEETVDKLSKSSHINIIKLWIKDEDKKNIIQRTAHYECNCLYSIKELKYDTIIKINPGWQHYINHSHNELRRLFIYLFYKHVKKFSSLRYAKWEKHLKENVAELSTKLQIIERNIQNIDVYDKCANELVKYYIKEMEALQRFADNYSTSLLNTTIQAPTGVSARRKQVAIYVRTVAHLLNENTIYDLIELIDGQNYVNLSSYDFTKELQEFDKALKLLDSGDIPCIVEEDTEDDSEEDDNQNEYIGKRVIYSKWKPNSFGNNSNADWKSYNDEQKRLYPNHGKLWTGEDKELLIQLFVDENYSIEALSKLFLRNEHAIEMQLERAEVAIIKYEDSKD